MSSGSGSRPVHPRDNDDWFGIPASWGRVILGVAVGVVGTLLFLKLTDKDDDVAAAGRDFKRSAEAKGREIKDSWTR